MKQGISFKEYPFKFIWLATPLPEPVPVQVVIAVPKRRINKASSRNTVKRRIRESYRKQKGLVYSQLQQQGAQLALMILFNGPEDMEYTAIDAALNKGLKRLPTEYEKLEGHS